MTASFFVSAIQISCSARFAFVCRLFGSLFRTLAVLCTQQRCSRVVAHTSPSAFQKPSAPSATASSGAAAKPRRLRSSSRSRHDCALAHAIRKADQLLLALRGGADDDENALRLVLEPRLQVDAVGPEVDVALHREIALLPALVFIGPPFLEASNRRCRQTGRILADKRGQRLLEVAGRDALQVEDRNQHLQTLRAPRVGRQDGRVEPNALTRSRLAVAYPRLAHANRTNASHDLALGQMPVARHAPAARLGLEIAMSVQKVSDLRLNRLRQQGACPTAQNLGERIDEGPWLRELDDVIVGHGVSLLQWRSGGVEHPHDTPPYPAAASHGRSATGSSHAAMRPSRTV